MKSPRDPLPPCLPFFSEPVIAEKAPISDDACHEPFGYTWQEITTRVEAFSVVSSNCIESVENVPHDETRNSIGNYEDSKNSRCFVLHAGEYVTKVEVYATDTVIKALRLHTTKRVSFWFGERTGSRTLFQAERGLCINALQGKSANESCFELGVVYAPLAIVAEGHCAARSVEMAGAVHMAGISSMYEYRTCCDFPRAVVVKIGESIESVRVVSAAEYDRITRFSEPFQCDATEYWLVLAEGEWIEAVDLTIDETRVSRMRLKTNMQTSTTFGCGWDGDTTTLDTIEFPGSYICGFEYGTDEVTTDGGMNYIRVLCTPLAAADAAAVSHAPSKAA